MGRNLLNWLARIWTVLLEGCHLGPYCVFITKRIIIILYLIDIVVRLFKVRFWPSLGYRMFAPVSQFECSHACHNQTEEEFEISRTK